MRTYSLTPILKPSESKTSFAVCDIESANWTKFLTIGYYDGSQFRHFEKLGSFFDFIFSSNDDRDVFAHFGGKFDFLFLLQEVLGHADYTVKDFIPRGSGILSFTLTRMADNKDVTFRDSSALLPFSLRRLTQSFNVTHKKLEIDYTKIKKVTPQLLEYLKYDCIGLYESIEKFFSWPLIQKAGPAHTIAGQSLRALRTYLKKPIPGLSQSVDSFVRKGYFGGRTEIFKPLYESRDNPIRCYDVNSLYPTVMRDCDFPGGFDYYTRRYEGSKHGFYEATVTVPKSLKIPPLGIIRDGKFIFPTGTFSGVWYTKELEYARTLEVTFKTGRGAVFKNAGPLFRDFVNDLYKIRVNSPKDSVDNTIAKLLMNSCYGRFGLNRVRENLVFDEGQIGVRDHVEIKVGQKTFRLAKEPKILETFTNVAVAAAVTAYARIYMHRLYSVRPEEIYYTDTDSMFTTFDFSTGEGLGDLKLEYSANSACFLLPKTYITSGEKTKIAMKGFDAKKIQNFTMQDFKACLEGDLKRLKIIQEPKFATLKTALKQKSIVSMTKATTREIRSKYDKREFVKLPDGRIDSVPLHLTEA